jgi:hypothetical protein
MDRAILVAVAIVSSIGSSAMSARAETPDEWIALGARRLRRLTPPLKKRALARALAIVIGISGLFLTGVIAGIAVYPMRTALGDRDTG